MISKLLPLVLIVGAAAARAQVTPAPDAPDKLKPPAAEQVIFLAHATGVQIYTCQQSADGKYAWTLKGPDAELHDEHGAVVGHHFAGPTWKHNDGSEVMGKMAAKVDAPDGNSIPWLLLSATSHNGEGVFAKVTSIQRLHTRGGKAPADSECAAAKVNSEARIDYTADYYFFAPAKESAAGGSDCGVESNRSGPVMGVISSTAVGPKPGQKVRISSKVLDSLVVNRVQPIYPEDARSQHVEGEVLLRVNLDAQGSICKLEQESGDGLLAAAALAAVKQWRFRRYMLNGQPVASESQVKISFSLAP